MKKHLFLLLPVAMLFSCGTESLTNGDDDQNVETRQVDNRPFYFPTVEESDLDYNFEGAPEILDVYRRSYAIGFVENVRDISLHFVRDGYPEKGIPPHITAHFEYSDAVGVYRDAAEENLARFDALCEKHNDMTFNRSSRVYPGTLTPLFTANDFVSVEIVSDADYDTAHPAGTSLADVFAIYYRSGKPYIDSGYDANVMPPYLGALAVLKPMSELAHGDLSLIQIQDDGDCFRTSIFLEVWSMPTLSKEHTFTVSLTDENGKTFTDNVKASFN